MSATELAVLGTVLEPDSVVLLGVDVVDALAPVALVVVPALVVGPDLPPEEHAVIATAVDRTSATRRTRMILF
ncbi:MAG: hypothetical protein WCI22_00265 [Actinomycetota bacterium]